MPTVVQFVNGASTIVPQAGGYPIVPPDYEPSDQNLIFAAAKGLNTLAGEKRASLIGNTGFFKFDVRSLPMPSATMAKRMCRPKLLPLR